MSTWKGQESKEWADQFIPHIKSILGYVFIQEAPIEQDIRENTDLVFMVFNKRFAIRIRDMKDRPFYNRRNEWTIRLSRPSGVSSELTKLMKGWGDYCLYGWGDETTKKVKAFTIFDLHEVRWWIFHSMLETNNLPGTIFEVKDHSATFLAICIDDMPKESIKWRHMGNDRKKHEQKPLALNGKSNVHV